MIISCPTCGASFNVKPEALGPTGRSVKCSKCAHRWHATADDGPSEESPVANADDATAEPAAEASADDTPAAAESADTESVADGDAGDAVTAEPDETEPSAAPDVPAGLEAALGLAAGSDADEDEEPAPSRKRRRTSPPSTSKPRRNMAKILSLFVLLLLVTGIAGAAFFLDQKIMTWMPATQRLYAMVGLHPNVLGQGLQIVEPKPKKEVDGNDEILIVEGEIRNTTEAPMDIPLMRAALLDNQGKELHLWTFTAAKSKIAPGENAQYRTEFRNPPVAAESLDITFTRANAVMEAAKHDVKMEKTDEAETKPHGMTEEGTNANAAH